MLELNSTGRRRIRSAPRRLFSRAALGPDTLAVRLAALALWAAALAVAGLLLFAAHPTPARGASFVAQAGIAMSWNDCPGGVSSASNQAFACDNDVSSFPLVCAVATDTAEANIIGAELVVDVQLSGGAMPDWWRFDGSGTAGCRAGALATSFDFSASPGCTDAWLAQAFGGIQGFSIGPPDHPLGSQARIKAVAAVTSDHAVVLNPGIEYGMIRLILSSQGSSGGACAGCGLSACLVLNSILLRRTPSLGPDVYLITPASAGANWATWQGTGANCVAVPTRRSTWGQIKSLYR